MGNQISGFIESLGPLAVQYGMSVLGAILILIAGYIVAGWAAKRVMKWGNNSDKVDDTIVPVLSKVTKIFVLIVTLLAVLGQFGVETTSIVAVLGASALAIGLALQGTLSNVASGVMLLTLRPFSVGDAVSIAGTSGVVDSIGLFTTEMHSFDNIGISIPNSKVWGSEIRNMNRFDTRRVDMQVGIGYEDNMDKAMKVIKEVLDSDDRVLSEPEPLIAIAELGDSAVVINVRPWAKTSDVWPLRFDFTKKVKERFDEEDISFPFPQRDVHLFQQN
jgi:small conductance mechanosensitive channel